MSEEVLLLVGLFVLVVGVLVMMIPGCRDARSLGLLVMVIGFFVGGWPVILIGAGLVAFHHWNERRVRDDD